MPRDFIYIYGPPASGKTTIGRALAEKLGLAFYDLDEQIELRQGRTIPEIFASAGEAGFRLCEAEALKDVALRPSGVCALGGGALLLQQNRSLVESNGRVLCLSASFETILNRLGGDESGRPLLDGDSKAQLRVLLEHRAAHYASFPLQLSSADSDAAQTAQQAQILLGRYRVGGMGKPYEVRILPGSLGDLGELLRDKNLTGPLAVVSDSNVAEIYAHPAIASLHSSGFSANSIVIPAGEAHKTFATVQSLLDGFINCGLDRSSTVVALGGGVVGDLAGFAAAIFLRGVRWVAVPTSLLAMVDASLGGKTGADLPQGKNLVGAFHPPALVLADSRNAGHAPTGGAAQRPG